MFSLPVRVLRVTLRRCSVAPWALYSQDLATSQPFTTSDKVKTLTSTRHASSLDEHDRKQIQPQKLRRRKERQDARPFPSDDSWSETFGTISEDAEGNVDLDKQRFPADEADKDDTEDKPFRRLSAVDRKNTPTWYGMQIEKLAKQGKVYEAVAMLEQQMIEKDRVMPSRYVFTVLIGALGRVGYTKKAFSLFNKMKKYGLQPEDPTYTALFNACSNSPWKEDGLQRANNLRRLMSEKEYEPNSLTCQAMIKAYGVLGDLETAFSIADVMTRRRLKTTVDTLNMLLMAAISDREAGLRHAIMVWKRFLKRRVVPNTISYNLLLRAVRDCGVGDMEFSKDLLTGGSQQRAQLSSGEIRSTNVDAPVELCDAGGEARLLSEGNGSPSSTESEHSALTTIHTQQEAKITTDVVSSPNQLNILNPRIDLSEVVVGFGSLEKPAERLGLLGGVRGVLSIMKQDQVPANVKTITLLLDLVEDTMEAEEQLLSAMEELKVQADTGLLNQVIRRRCKRGRLAEAKMTLDYFSRYSVVPDMATYGCLAMGCRRQKDGLQLLHDMKDQDIVPGVQLWGILMYQSHLNFHYKLQILKQMKELNVRPNKAFLEHTERSVDRARKLIVQSERGDEVPDFIHTERFQDGFRQFMLFYKAWLVNTDLLQEKHPWSGFREPVQDDS